MDLLLQSALFAHIIFGILAIVVFYLVWIILKGKETSSKFVLFCSLAGLIFFILSWVSGGYYYVVHYGSAVKPLILSGSSPWAHKIFMEAKEHVFLFLPFLAGIVFLVSWLSGDAIVNNPNLKRVLTFLTSLIIVLGILIAVEGVIISWAVGS